jgi:hypothetical protein
VTSARALALALFLALGTAHAQSAADLETARSLLRDARAARDTGNNTIALEKFRAAFAVLPTPIIGVELSKTYVLLGQLLEGRETFLSVSRIKVAPDESSFSAQARTDAQTLAEEVRPRIPSIIVRVQNPAGATIMVDGSVIALELLGQARKVNPGAHRVEVRYPDGKIESKDVAVEEGKTEEAALGGAAVAQVVVPPPVVKKPTESSADISKPLMFGGFGVAGAGLLVGTVTGIVAFGKGKDATALCVDTRCPPSAQPLVSSARTWATVSTVSFVVGALGAGVGVVGLVLRPKAAPAQTSGSGGVSLGIGFGSATLTGSF